MELKDYIAIIRKNIVFIASTVVLGAAIAYFYAANMPSGYTANQTFVIVPTESKDDTTRGFYQQEKSRNFTDTAAAILENQNPGILRVQKIAPQIIKITASGRNQAQTESNLQEGVSRLNETLQNLQSENSLKIKPIVDAPQATKITLNKKVITLFGATVGAITALLAIGLKSYLKL